MCVRVCARECASEECMCAWCVCVCDGDVYVGVYHWPSRCCSEECNLQHPHLPSDTHRKAHPKRPDRPTYVAGVISYTKRLPFSTRTRTVAI